MEKPDFKYNLNKVILATDKSISISSIEKQIEESYGIPPYTFRKHRAIKKSDSAAIREDHLAFYASYFNVSADELRNYELEAGKVIKQTEKQKVDNEKKALKGTLGLNKRKSAKA